MRAIYSITNITNDKRYIGETMDVKRRWEEHEEDLNNNSHHSYKLQQDWNELGRDKFKFDIVTVLDESISNYVDKYILLIYEGYYILKYDSINNGYNIENTLEKVLNDEKIIFNSNDKQVLNTYYKRIEKEDIVNSGGLIYLAHTLTFKELCDKLNKDTRELTKLMIQQNIIYKDIKRYSLTNEYKNNYDITLDDNSSMQKMKFSNDGFKEIYNKLKDIPIDYKKIIRNNETNDNINENVKTEAKQDNNEKCTIREYLNNYTLNIPYNDIFKFLRENNIFEYKFRENGKKDNRPTKEYESWFTYEDNIGSKGSDYIRMYVSDIGKTKLYNLLYDNMLVNNK